ncbi:ankyrin repeat domain-containing protein [Candidatus Micrarchaeota archaeon]|nr:ankyrin repeat domain-containing protein [Candidatus Micrarchaeota archaeon]
MDKQSRHTFDLWNGIISGNADRVYSAVQNGVDVNDIGPDYQPALYGAIYCSFVYKDRRDEKKAVELVRILLSKYPDVNAAEGKNGWTPLHLAAANGLDEIFLLLLERYADIGIKTKDGKTALELAEANGHWYVAEILERAAYVDFETPRIIVCREEIPLIEKARMNKSLACAVTRIKELIKKGPFTVWDLGGVLESVSSKHGISQERLVELIQDSGQGSNERGISFDVFFRRREEEELKARKGRDREISVEYTVSDVGSWGSSAGAEFRRTAEHGPHMDRNTQGRNRAHI